MVNIYHQSNANQTLNPKPVRALDNKANYKGTESFTGCLDKVK